jgi:chemotaxis protein methyltransferase CheR
MKKAECRDFLAWALPRIGLSPPAFRKVRGQVCKRVARRMRDLGISGHRSYRDRLEADDDEWRRLDSLCRITITRFCRDRDAWIRLREAILPGLADRGRGAGRTTLRAWSAGCGGGEEAYSLRILWELDFAGRFPSLRLEIVATDADTTMLQRARDAVYRRGTLREVPPEWIGRAFEENGESLRLRPEYQAGIGFELQDMRVAMPDGPFDLVLCRYLAFTYFDADGRRAALQGIAHRLRPGGILMLGVKEYLPAWSSEIVPECSEFGFWRRRDDARTPCPQAAP